MQITACVDLFLAEIAKHIESQVFWRKNCLKASVSRPFACIYSSFGGYFLQNPRINL